IGFVVALPLLVWMIAVACHADAWRARPGRAAVALGVVSLLTFVAHLEAWAVGAVAAVAALLAGSMPWRARASGLPALAPSVAACIAFVARTAGDPRFSGEPSFARALVTSRLAELAGHGVVFDFWGRLRGLPVHLLRGFNDGSDVFVARVF